MGTTPSAQRGRTRIEKEYKMDKNRKVIRKNPIPEAFRGKVYLDPTYDPAFKEFFGSEAALKDFLDGVLDLEGDDKIKTLRFRFEEPVEFRLPERKILQNLRIFPQTCRGDAATSCRRRYLFGFATSTCPMPRGNIWTSGRFTAGSP